MHVNIGAHGQREGLAAHWELWSLVQGGMTPMAALRAGTLAGAQYLGMDRHLGSLEVGKLADLMILDADPRTDIRVTSQVAMVMIGGRLFDAATMVEIGGSKTTPAPFDILFSVAEQIDIFGVAVGGHCQQLVLGICQTFADRCPLAGADVADGCVGCADQR